MVVALIRRCVAQSLLSQSFASQVALCSRAVSGHAYRGLDEGKSAFHTISATGAVPRVQCTSGKRQSSRTSPAEAAALGKFAAEEGADAEFDDQTGVKVYRRARAEHQRVFQWGVGGRFRMQAANRFVPVHKPHPKEITVRDDYFKSDNPNIVWEDLNESWEVYWYEHSKLNARPFPVKKYGLERSKVEAFHYYEQLKSEGRLGDPTRHAQPQVGVFFDARLQCWVSLFWRDGRPLSRCWSATKYGYDGARALAVAKRNDPVNGVLPLAHPGGGTPAIDKVPGGLGGIGGTAPRPKATVRG